MFKITIPNKVEKKIRRSCSIYPNNEWSGVLFYKVEGTFEDNNLNIICEDILPLNLGSSTYTQFDYTTEVAVYIANNIELSDCFTGLYHSHNTMKCWFSGTDLSTLKKEGEDCNHFVSLIVNNAGEYCAKITRKLYYRDTGVREIKYNTFRDEEVSYIEDIPEGEFKYKLESFDLEINKEEVYDELKDFEDRMFALRKSVITNTLNNQFTNKAIASKNEYPYLKKEYPFVKHNTSYKQRDLFEDIEEIEDIKDLKSLEDKELYIEEDIIDDNNLIDEEDYSEVYEELRLQACEIVTQIITLSVLTPLNDKFNQDEYIKRMESILDKRFNKDYEHYARIADSLCELLIDKISSELKDEFDAYTTLYEIIVEELESIYEEYPNEYIGNLLIRLS